MKNASAIGLAFSLFALGGCMNIMAHKNGHAGPFIGCHANLEMGASFSYLYCVGLPFEFVADMITLPYDIIKD